MRRPGPLPRMACRTCGKDVAASERIAGRLTEREHRCPHGNNCLGCPECPKRRPGKKSAAAPAVRRTIEIPRPVAAYGETVSVLNYRRKPAAWEEGTIAGLGWRNDFGGAFSWSYRVRLGRLGKRGPIFVQVGDFDCKPAVGGGR